MQRRTRLAALLGVALASAALVVGCTARAPATSGAVPVGQGAAAPLTKAATLPDLAFTVPQGTFAAELRNEPIFEMPSEIRLKLGQAIAVTNQDQAMHYFFDVPVAPGQSFRKSFNQVGSFGYSPGLSCSLAREGGVTVIVEAP